MFGVNMNSPYEAAKRLSRESQSLMNTGERYLKYLEKMEQHDNNSEETVLRNYEKEFEKVETVYKTLVKMLTEHKERL